MILTDILGHLDLDIEDRTRISLFEGLRGNNCRVCRRCRWQLLQRAAAPSMGVIPRENARGRRLPIKGRLTPWTCQGSQVLHLWEVPLSVGTTVGFASGREVVIFSWLGTAVGIENGREQL